MFLNDIKDLNNQFTTIIREDINILNVFITKKEEADLQLSL